MPAGRTAGWIACSHCFKATCMRKHFRRFLDLVMPDGPPIFLVAIIGFLVAAILRFCLGGIKIRLRK
jgi:hypothetical protein